METRSLFVHMRFLRKRVADSRARKALTSGLANLKRGCDASDLTPDYPPIPRAGAGVSPQGWLPGRTLPASTLSPISLP